MLPSGVRLGRLDHILKDMVNIREAQFVQEQPDAVTLRIARGRNYGDADEKMLRKELRQRIGDSLRLDLDYVEAVPRGPNGKLRLVLSTLNKRRGTRLTP